MKYKHPERRVTQVRKSFVGKVPRGTGHYSTDMSDDSKWHIDLVLNAK